MITVNASNRLKVMADADETLARQYLKEVAGISVGNRQHTQPDLIRFEITPEQFETARKTLPKFFGPIKSDKLFQSAGGTFYVNPAHTKAIIISDRKFGGGQRNVGYSISMVDTSHKETHQQMLRRILGPIRDVKR